MLALTLGLGLAIAGCGGSPASTKYTQTWTKSYSTTTCSDWFNSMDVHQKFVMADDFILTFQRKTKPDAPIPSDDTALAFIAAMDRLCTEAEKNGVDQLIAGVATEVYTRGNFQP